MKTAVSLPDDLFGQAERFARKTGKSRSQVFREALSEYLLRRDSAALTNAMDQAISEIRQTPDPWLTEAARQALDRNEW